MSDQLFPDDNARRESQRPLPSPFAEPMPPSPPIAPEAWGEVGAAAMNVAEFPYQMNGDFAASASALAGVILRYFPHDGGSVEEFAMHNVGRVLAHLCGVTVAVEND